MVSLSHLVEIGSSADLPTSRIYKSKYADDEADQGSNDRRGRDKGKDGTPEKKGRDKSRTRTIFGRKKSVSRH